MDSYYGLLQAFADALKLLLKEYVSPTQANMVLFFLGPIITLVFSLLGYAVVPYGPGLAIWDFNLGILYMLAVSSLSTYGILLAGWSANSKYAFLGSLRSTAQLISYELILTSAILLVILFTGSLNLTVNIEVQRVVWFIIPLLPVFVIFFIGSVAETNRAPFDLAEAESELVSGFMTEHSAVIFVFFFLAEYASIVLICIITSILFLGGYLLYYIPLIYILQEIDYTITDYAVYLSFPIIEGLLYGLSLGLKASIMIFTFIWTRASFPRIRFDQLMLFSWTILLPLVIAFIVLLPCLINCFDLITSNISLAGFSIVTMASKKHYSTSRDSDTLSTLSDESADESKVDPLNGTQLDRTRDVSLYCKTQAQAQEYFHTKEESIKSSHRQDSNTAAADGVPASELSGWLERKESLLLELAGQKSDVYDDNDFSDDNDSRKGGGNGGTGGASDGGDDGASEGDDGSSDFPQDSSDIVPTDFDSSDYYDD